MKPRQILQVRPSPRMEVGHGRLNLLGRFRTVVGALGRGFQVQGVGEVGSL